MKKIFRCILGLGSFLLVLLIVIMVLCVLFVPLTENKEKKELEPLIIETNAQLDFIFEDGDVITQDDFENNTATKVFTVFNNSDPKADVASAYQLYFDVLKYKNFKLGDVIYTVVGVSTGEGKDDKLINTGTLAFPSLSSSIGIGTIKPQIEHTYKIIIQYVGKENIKNKEFEMQMRLVGNITYISTSNK